MYRRAKVYVTKLDCVDKIAEHIRLQYLYDSDFEEDKLAVIQSTVLLAFFYTDTEDRTGAWHWTSTAISLCQGIGLHRDLETITPKDYFTKRKLSIFRRIWWSCFVRDRWLSLGFGRPMKIQLHDCDTPMPTIEDVTMDLKDIPSSVVEKYLFANQTRLAKLWIKFVKLSKALGSMIQIFYRLQRSTQDIEHVKQCEDEILQSDSGCAGKDDTDPITAFHTYHLQIFHE